MKTQRTNLMSRVAISLVFCVVIVFWGFQVSGEEWNDAQKEVWTVVETGWEYIRQGNMEAISALDRIEGSLEWWSDRTVPFEENDIKLQYKRWVNFNKPVFYELEPLNIHIVGDVANVFYLWKWKGTYKVQSGRQMNTYIKQDNQWKYMGGMGCSCDKLPYCK